MRYTLARACALLSSYCELDDDLFIDSSSFVSNTSRNQDLADLLWEAHSKIYTECRYKFVNQTFIPQANDQDISLVESTPGTRFGFVPSRITRVMIGNRFLRTRSGTDGLWSFDEFDRYFFQRYQNQSGSPSFATQSNGLLMFERKFSAGAVATGGFALEGYGCLLPFDYAGSSASLWAVHPDLQDAVVKRAAIDAKLPYATEASELGILERFRQESDEAVRRFLLETKTQQSPFQSPGAYDRPDDFMRI